MFMRALKFIQSFYWCPFICSSPSLCSIKSLWWPFDWEDLWVGIRWDDILRNTPGRDRTCSQSGGTHLLPSTWETKSRSEFKTGMTYIRSWRLAWATWNSGSKKEGGRNKGEEKRGRRGSEWAYSCKSQPQHFQSRHGRSYTEFD